MFQIIIRSYAQIHTHYLQKSQQKLERSMLEQQTKESSYYIHVRFEQYQRFQQFGLLQFWRFKCHSIEVIQQQLNMKRFDSSNERQAERPISAPVRRRHQRKHQDNFKPSDLIIIIGEKRPIQAVAPRSNIIQNHRIEEVAPQRNFQVVQQNVQSVPSRPERQASRKKSKSSSTGRTKNQNVQKNAKENLLYVQKRLRGLFSHKKAKDFQEFQQWAKKMLIQLQPEDPKSASYNPIWCRNFYQRLKNPKSRSMHKQTDSKPTSEAHYELYSENQSMQPENNNRTSQQLWRENFVRKYFIDEPKFDVIIIDQERNKLFANGGGSDQLQKIQNDIKSITPNVAVDPAQYRRQKMRKKKKTTQDDLIEVRNQKKRQIIIDLTQEQQPQPYPHQKSQPYPQQKSQPQPQQNPKQKPQFQTQPQPYPLRPTEVKPADIEPIVPEQEKKQNRIGSELQQREIRDNHMS